MSGYLQALTLIQIVPEKREQIWKRADEYAYSRMICGAHYKATSKQVAKPPMWCSVTCLPTRASLKSWKLLEKKRVATSVCQYLPTCPDRDCLRTTWDAERVRKRSARR
jgi:hypothetical protein